ncbi:MAG: single-stranded DNA-binding protein [Ruminococcaceae bacterium]|nr:single-stranded DNA-binding protein [Oscillospiraceae bacterium]
MLNKVILMGRLTKDPELRHTQSGLPVVSFSLAVDRGFKADGQSVDFINVVAWRNTAEFVAKWFTKGQLVAVSGRLQARTYKDREGYNRVITEVVADEVYFAEKPSQSLRDSSPEVGAKGLASPFGRGGSAADGEGETEPALPAGEFEELYGEDGELPF